MGDLMDDPDDKVDLLQFVVPPQEDDLPQDDPHSHNLTELAYEVLDGKWGSTESWQIRKLKKAGLDSQAVMAEVRRLSE